MAPGGSHNICRNTAGRGQPPGQRCDYLNLDNCGICFAGYISFLQPLITVWGIAIIILTMVPETRQYYAVKK